MLNPWVSYKTLYSKLREAHVTADLKANFSPKIWPVMRAAEALCTPVTAVLSYVSTVAPTGYWDLPSFPHQPWPGWELRYRFASALLLSAHVLLRAAPRPRPLLPLQDIPTPRQ